MAAMTQEQIDREMRIQALVFNPNQTAGIIQMAEAGQLPAEHINEIYEITKADRDHLIQETKNFKQTGFIYLKETVVLEYMAKGILKCEELMQGLSEYRTEIHL